MEAAKAHVKKFISRDGHHDTTIDEKVAPAVQHETVKRTQHEQATTAVDREVHQDHYHTSEQPVFDKEVLPEQHHQNILSTEERAFEHDNPSQVKERLAAEQAKYRDTQTHVEGERTAEAAPVVGGEHVHHHVHETIQPIINKETVEPHVVHTVKPIHEVHHNAAHHTASALPPVSMDEFKKQGGSLTGRAERHDAFEGCPPEQFAQHGHKSHDSGLAAGAGAGALGGAAATRHRSGSASSSDNEKRTDKAGLTGGAVGAAGGHGHQHPEPASYGNDMHVKTDGKQQNKPSLMDKLNPKVDANGDGKPGFMK